MSPSLLVLAAGMGSRYGGLKQIDTVGPNGETIIEYSVFDAIRAGFKKVVFVIRHSFEKEFMQVINSNRFDNKIEVQYVFQELDYLPKGFSVPEGREKPWGTNHAILMAKEVINEPFAIINADDFYGKDAFKTIAKYLQSLDNTKGKYCMVAYELKNTLSENGSVSRGVCNISKDDLLMSMTERTSILKKGDRIVYTDKDIETDLSPNTKVSMNLFGFTPDYFVETEKLFIEFLQQSGNQLKSEFYIPFAVNTLINNGYAELKVLNTSAQWFGVTYKEDKPLVMERLALMHKNGEYPERF